MSNKLRPLDEVIRDSTTLMYGPYNSEEACRRILQLAFRDAVRIIDLTFAHKGFWNLSKLPPGILLYMNDIDPSADTHSHEDFTNLSFRNNSFDVAVFDPPHVADGGRGSIMGTRFGTIKTTKALENLIQLGAQEAWRISKVGIIVKVTDHSHGGEFLIQSDWVKEVIPVRPYFVMHTYRSTYVRDGKHRQERVPRSNGATYLVFRKDGHKHISFGG